MPVYRPVSQRVLEDQQINALQSYTTRWVDATDFTEFCINIKSSASHLMGIFIEYSPNKTDVTQIDSIADFVGQIWDGNYLKIKSSYFKLTITNRDVSNRTFNLWLRLI